MNSAVNILSWAMSHQLLLRDLTLIFMLSLMVFVASRLQMGNRDILWAAVGTILLMFVYLVVFNAAYLPVDAGHLPYVK